MSTDLKPQNNTLTGALPLDRPTAERPHRLYVATSNHCNRSCPWCCTCSSPKGSTFLELEAFLASFPQEGFFEVQLEGGEPTVHPYFSEMIRLSRQHPRCTRVVVVTNGVEIPRRAAELDVWLEKLEQPLTIKLSVNHHLLERDKGLLTLAQNMRERMQALGGDRQLVLNVRLRKGTSDDDAWIVQAVCDAGLIELANIFFLQRYGFARHQQEWEEPFIVGTNFSLVNPDGRVFGPNLLARSEAMRELP